MTLDLRKREKEIMVSCTKKLCLHKNQDPKSFMQVCTRNYVYTKTKTPKQLWLLTIVCRRTRANEANLELILKFERKIALQDSIQRSQRQSLP